MFSQFIIANLQQMLVCTLVFLYMICCYSLLFKHCAFCLFDVFRVFFDFLRVVFFFSSLPHSFPLALFIKHNKQYQSAAPGSSVYMSTKISNAHAHMLLQDKVFLCIFFFLVPIKNAKPPANTEQMNFHSFAERPSRKFMVPMNLFRRQFYVLSGYATLCRQKIKRNMVLMTTITTKAAIAIFILNRTPTIFQLKLNELLIIAV